MGQHSAKVYHEKPNDDSTQARQLYSKGAHTKRQFSSGVATDIGGRPYQEDRYIVIDNLQSYSPHVTVPSALYIVLDGHGGFQCAEFVKTNFVDIFCQTEEFQSCDYAAALRVTFKKLEKTWVEYAVLSKMEGWSSGTCVLASFVVQSGMYVAWVGDCRMAGYNDHDQKHVQHVTTDHKPGSPKELSRILKVGGSVKHVHVHGGCFRSVKGPDRVFPGGLAVARSIGTIRCKDARLGAVKGAVHSSSLFDLVDRVPVVEFVVYGIVERVVWVGTRVVHPTGFALGWVGIGWHPTEVLHWVGIRVDTQYPS